MDANQQSIVEDLRKIPGCTVVLLSACGGGIPDLLVGYRGANLLVELKNPDTLQGGNPGTKAKQQEFRDTWTGQVLRAYTFLEILNYMTGNYSEPPGAFKKLNAASFA